LPKQLKDSSPQRQVVSQTTVQLNRPDFKIRALARFGFRFWSGGISDYTQAAFLQRLADAMAT